MVIYSWFYYSCAFYSMLLVGFCSALMLASFQGGARPWLTGSLARRGPASRCLQSHPWPKDLRGFWHVFGLQIYSFVGPILSSSMILQVYDPLYKTACCLVIYKVLLSIPDLFVYVPP